MNQEIYDILMQLKTLLNDDSRIKHLIKANENLENSDEAKILSFKMDNALREYNDILKIYPLESDEAKKYQHNLFLAKKELDKLDVVKRYNKAYKEVRELYKYINEEIFMPLSPSLCEKNKI